MVTTTKVCVVFFMLCAATLVFAQETWVPAEGDWNIATKKISQNDATNKLSRIDGKIVDQSNIVISFNADYIDGGFYDEEMLMNGEYHAGFGVHVGVEDPALRQKSWGNGNSYLLWINLDTREEIRRTRPEHYGLRAQVYKSNSASNMNLVKTDLVTQNAELRSLVVDDYASVDLIKTIEKLSGAYLSIEDVINYFNPTGVDVRISINTSTGEVSVMDPTNTRVHFSFTLDPEVLRGDYISIRTNNVALNFSDVAVY